MANKEANIVIRLRDRASSGFKKLGGAVGSVLRPIGKVAGALTGLVSLAGGAFLVSAIRNTGSFGEQLSILQGVTRGSAEEMAALEAAARDAGATTRFTATEAGQGLEELARSGQNAREAIATLNPVLNLAAGNNQTVAESAIQVTTAMNAFGLAAEEAGRVSDVFTRTAQRSAQTTAQLGEAMTFVAPVARQAGLEIEETAALIGKLADAGFRGSLGGTALRNAILQFQDPASQFRKELARIGIQTDDFVTAMAGLSDAGGDAEAAIRSLGLRAGPAIQAIVAGGAPALRQLTEELNNAEGASEEAAKALEDNLPGAFRNLQSAFGDLQIELTKPLTDKIKEGIFDLADVIRNFTQSDVIAGFRDLLVKAFDAGRRAVENFISGIDFQEAGARIQTFTQNASARLETFRQDVELLAMSFTRFAGFVNFLIGSVRAAFNGLGTVIGGVVTTVAFFLEKLFVLFEKVTFGVDEFINSTAEKLKALRQALQFATGDFAGDFLANVDQISVGLEQMTRKAESASTQTTNSLRKIGDEAGNVARISRASLDEVSQALNEWGTRTAEAAESSDQLTESAGELADAGDRAAESLEKVGTAGAEAGAQIIRIEGAAGSLQIVTDEAINTSAAFDGLAASIDRAGTQTELDALAGQVQNLAAQGGLTEKEVRALIAAINDQAAAMQSAASSTAGNTKSLRDLAGAASSTASGLGEVGRQARGASQGAKNLVNDMGNAINIWRDAGPEAVKRVEDFVFQWNQIGLFTFEGARNRINRFVEGMEREFGPATEAIEKYNNRLRETDRDSRRLSESTRRLNSDVSQIGGAEITQRIIVEFKRDANDSNNALVSEQVLNTITARVLEAINRDQDRTG